MSASNDMEKICEAYEHHRKKPELQAMKQLSRQGRRYGFHLVFSGLGKSENQQIQCAARLLISVSRCWDESAIPEGFHPAPQSVLYADAARLMASARGLSNQLEVEGYAAPGAHQSWKMAINGLIEASRCLGASSDPEVVEFWESEIQRYRAMVESHLSSAETT